MKKITVSILVLTILSLACSNTTTMAQPVTATIPSPKLDTVVQYVVTAEIGVQVRKGCGIEYPTTGIILVNGETVTATGPAVVLPDMSLWQPIEQGCKPTENCCVNAAYLEPVK